jgi:hypothetical protein
MGLLGADSSAGAALTTRVLWGLGALLGTTIAYWLRRGYQVRCMFRSLQKQGIVRHQSPPRVAKGRACVEYQLLTHQGQPIMKHSMILGHLEHIGNIMSSVPSDAHGDYMLAKIQENWKTLFPGESRCPPVVYVDIWPFTGPLIILIDASVAAQCTQDHSLIKAPQQKHFLYHLTRNRDVASMEGPEWKVWRKRLNPGFSVQTLTSRVPELIEEAQDFVDILVSRAGKDGQWGDVFPLEELTTNLTLDMLYRFSL